MILDFHGRALKPTIGFIGGFTLVCEVLPEIDAINLVGSERVKESDDEENDRAAPRKRMRRAA